MDFYQDRAKEFSLSPKCRVKQGPSGFGSEFIGYFYPNPFRLPLDPRVLAHHALPASVDADALTEAELLESTLWHSCVHSVAFFLPVIV